MRRSDTTELGITGCAIALVMCLRLTPSSMAAEALGGLVGQWRFDGEVGGEVKELCGIGNHAALIGACRDALDPDRGLHIPCRPVEGHALSKDHPFLRGEPRRLTVTAWVWWDGRGGGAAVSCPNRLVLGPRVWEVHCEKKAQKGWRAIVKSGMPPSTRWMHLAGVMDERGITFYRDGQAMGTKSLTKPMIGGSSDLRIGRSFGVAKWQMPGYLWEVRLYDRALAAGEVARLVAVRRTPRPGDLPRVGHYLPGRNGQTAVPFAQPDCTPFVDQSNRELTLTETDLRTLSMAGCGLYERVERSAWQENAGFWVSGEASASAPVRARIVFVGWPRGAELRTPSLATRTCGAAIDLVPKAKRFRVPVPVPSETDSGAVMLLVADRRDDPTTLTGTTIELGRLQYTPMSTRTHEQASVGDDPMPRLRSSEGLTLAVRRDGEIAALRADGCAFSGNGGWFVTDFAAENVPIPLVGAVSESPDGLLLTGASSKLKLAYRIEMLGQKLYIDCRAHLEDQSGQDRALMLELRLPLSSEQPWTWHSGGYERSVMRPGRRYETLSSGLTPGGQRNASVYPFVALSRGDAGLCVAVPLWDEPRLFRLVAHKPFVGDPTLGCEFELGLSAATKRFPSRASYRLVIYTTQPSWAFRRAVGRYYELFPEQFASAAKRHGNWAVLRMTQQYTPNLADFAIAADETVMGSPPADVYASVANQLLGIPTCPYLRPGTYSQEFNGHPSDPDAYEKRMALLADQERMPKHGYVFPNPYWGSPLSVLAQATRHSVLHDLDGRAVWRWPAPRRPGRYFMRCQQNCSYDLPSPNWAQVITRQYTLADDWARGAGARLGGVYFDNVCAASINAFDFRRDHWQLARFPLVVYADPPQPAHAKVLQLCEFFAKFSREVHRRGGILIGNFVRADAFAIGQYFDFIGHEGYQATVIERLRILAGPKPASYLPTAPATRQMFENCLSYGVAPGFGRASDRPLHREFMPLIVSLSEAGWQPVPGARYSIEGAVVERFGRFDSGNLSFTVRHPSQDGPDGVLRVDSEGAGIPDRDVIVMDMRREQRIEPRWEQGWLTIPLAVRAGRTEVVRVCRLGTWRRERMMRLASTLERAGREWNWVKAQHDDTLTARLGFEEDAGRWFRSGFGKAKVALSRHAHSGKSALLIESRQPANGALKTEPFSVRPELRHRLTFQYRSEGTGEVSAKAVFRPSWFGGDPVGEGLLGNLSIPSASGHEWRRFEAEVKPATGGVRMYLQLDFVSFTGRFSMDTFTLCPRFEPLPEVPSFGFLELCGEVRSALRSGRITQSQPLIRNVRTRLPAWQAAAARLPNRDVTRMAYEIAGIESAIESCQRE